MIEVKTKFDEKCLDVLQSYMVKKSFIVIICTSVLMVLLSVVSFTTDEFSMGVFTLTFGLLFPLLFWFLLWSAKNKQKKSMALLRSDAVNTFIFNEDVVRVESVATNGTESRGDTRYEMLFKAGETQTHFFLFISNIQAYVVPKSDFVSGSADELRALLRNKLGAKLKSKF